MNVHLFLEVLAAWLIALAAFKCPEPPHVSFAWLGVFILVLVLVLGGLRL